jgi:hypothetical protein
MKDAKKGGSVTSPRQEPSDSWWRRLVGYIKTKRDERKTKKQQETATDKAARTTARATVGIAIFTVVLAGTAIYQFIILKGQLEVMRKDLRAWIVVEQKSNQVSATVNSPLSTVLVYKNTGKTPASPVVGNFYIEIVPNGKAPHFEVNDAHNAVAAGDSLPNSPQEVAVTRMHFRPDGQSEVVLVTEAEKTALARGDAWIAIHGDMSYRDTFNTAHWIKFCFWGGGAPMVYGAQYCAAYNSIDHD